MLAFLFRGLTGDNRTGTALFDALTAEARAPAWYVAGEVPDTLDGRFAVLATVTALALVRLERDGEVGNHLSVALTERFVEVMESEHRELGLGDPTLGKVVRKLVAMLARKTDLWRAATSGGADWNTTTRESLYKAEVPAGAIEFSASALRTLWTRLEGTSVASFERGELA
jgi:cytochrome b pre-mRNA-processing protein 3